VTPDARDDLGEAAEIVAISLLVGGRVGVKLESFDVGTEDDLRDLSCLTGEEKKTKVEEEVVTRARLGGVVYFEVDACLLVDVVAVAQWGH